MDYVTDTHSLVWYFTEDERLSQNALAAFEETIEAGLTIISTIVLAEVMYICQKGRLQLTFGETLARLEKYDNFEIVPLDVDTLRIASGIDAELEMHDKLIVATALYFGTPLITKDEQIRKAKIIEVVW
jgi:PIN domain nuclease of toxin-antitoxin system